jgi:ubiquinone/menaquinone biosynthesis C-methylase UbiE
MAKDSVAEYFDEQAENYQQTSESWPWSWLRKRESSAVSQMMGDVTCKRVLDIGCGTGFYTRFFLSLGAKELVSIDRSPAMVKQLPDSKVCPIVADVAHIPLKPPFTHLLCAGLMEFLPDPSTVFAEAARLAGAQGRLVLLLPEKRLGGYLYRFFHRQHGVKIQLFKIEDLSHQSLEYGWSITKSKRIFPFSLVLKLERMG